MTDCETLEARLVDLCDDAVDGQERAELEQHLAACPRCRTAVEETRMLRAAYAALPEEDVAPELGAALLESSREAVSGDRPARPSRSPSSGTLRWPLAAAAAVLLAWVLNMAFGESTTAPKGEAAKADWLVQGQQLEHAGDLEGAERLYRQALLSSVQDAAAQRHRLGDLLLTTERYAEAAKTFSVVLDSFPGYTARDAVLVQLGRSLSGLGRLDEALSSYRLVADGPSPDRHEAELEIQAIESRMLSDQARENLRALGYIR